MASPAAASRIGAAGLSACSRALRSLAGRAAFRRVDEVGLAQHDSIGDRDLLDGLQMRVERRCAIDRVDHREHAVEAIAHRQIGVRHRGLQHRRWIGQAGRLQDHAAEHSASVVEIAQKLLQRVDQIAAQRAAQATALQQDDAVADFAHQQVVEADIAEFIDDDGGLGERRVADQAVEQRGLAGAEEAGQHIERNGLGWTQASLGGRHRACVVCGLVAVPISDGLGAGFLGFGFAATSVGAVFGAASLGAAVLGAAGLAAGLLVSVLAAAGLAASGLAASGLAAVLMSGFVLASAGGFGFFGLVSAVTGGGSPGLRAGAGIDHDRRAQVDLGTERSAPLAFGRRLARNTA